MPRFHHRTSPLRLSLLSVALSVAAQANAQTIRSGQTETEPTDLDKVLVVAQRADRISNGATNLDIPIKETPQSISVVTAGQMRDFAANNLNDALRLATGIQVEEWETNRTNYLARGFEIKNTQVDGVGLPNDWGIVTGAMDAFGYDKLEVIRGANGLLTGVGNASGTINYVRKRPTNEERGLLGVSVGSWGKHRVEVDYSTPLTSDGRWAGRVVTARESSDSYLRGYSNDRSFLYGVVDGQVGENGTLTFGYSWQQADSDGNMWGALTFNNADGSQAEWDRSASTTQDWTYWNTVTRTGFIEYAHHLGESWKLKASYNYRANTSDDQLFFAYTVTGLDPVAHTGLVGWAYKGYSLMQSHLGDISLSGTFEAFGREQDAMFGLSLARSRQDYLYNPTDSSSPAFGVLPPFPYAGNAVAEPDWGERVLDNRADQRLKRAYGAIRLTFTDRFKAVLGVNWSGYEREGVNIGEAFSQTKTSPYAGLTFDFNQDILGYASYSDIYQPQDQTDINGEYLAPTKGVNYEVGVKAQWLDKRLLTTLAWFSAKQEGLANYMGYDFDGGRYYYAPVDVQSKGFEFEATGRLGERTQLVFGYTHLQMDGADGHDTFPWAPRNTANLTVSTRLARLPTLSLGIGGRWQDRTWTEESYTTMVVRQGNYSVLNAFATWDIRPDLTLRANIGNLGDAKYINSMYQIGYYGAPRNYSLGLDWRF